METLSIVIPVYNEEKTLEELVRKVINTPLTHDIQKEIIIVNDASKDSSLEIANKLAKEFPFIKVLSNEKNSGKSQTVKNGLMATSGKYVIIQDADLEYEPSDFAEMLKMMIEEDHDVVYGNRFGRHNKIIYVKNYVGNKGISMISNLFTYPQIGVWIPDMETCYKLIRGDVARELAPSLTATSNFGFEPEITAKLSKYRLDGRKLKLGIYPIYYHARTIEEGKKMKAFKDGFKALKEIIHYNLFDK